MISKKKFKFNNFIKLEIKYCIIYGVCVNLLLCVCVFMHNLPSIKNYIHMLVILKLFVYTICFQISHFVAYEWKNCIFYSFRFCPFFFLFNAHFSSFFFLAFTYIFMHFMFPSLWIQDSICGKYKIVSFALFAQFKQEKQIYNTSFQIMTGMKRSFY